MDNLYKGICPYEDEAELIKMLDEVFFADEKQEAEKLLKRLAKEEYAVIYMTEKLASMIPQEIEKYTEAVTPAIILIPGVSGNTGDGMRNVSRFVEKAVGSDIIN